MKMRSRRILLSLIVVGISVSVTCVDASAQSATNLVGSVAVNSVVLEKDSSLVTTQAQVIVWKYKSVDGQIYKRQYNYSTGEWIGEWELC